MLFVDGQKIRLDHELAIGAENLRICDGDKAVLAVVELIFNTNSGPDKQMTMNQIGDGLDQCRDFVFMDDVSVNFAFGVNTDGHRLLLQLQRINSVLTG